MNKTVMINGVLTSLEEAKISVMDHGMLYGNGIFEGIRIYNSKIFKLKEHIDRLYASAELLGFEIDISKEQFIEDVIKTAKSANYKDAYIRITVSVQSYIDLSTPEYSINRVIILLDDDIIPEEKYAKGMSLVKIDRRRMPTVAIPMRAKTLNYLNSILALKDAHAKGGDDCVMLNTDNFVAETSASNIFYIKGNTLVTPHPDAGILVGITRNAVLDIGVMLGMETKEELFGIEELLNADEVFLTGTAYEIMPIRQVYDQQFSIPGTKTSLIRKMFQEYIIEHATTF